MLSVSILWGHSRRNDGGRGLGGGVHECWCWNKHPYCSMQDIIRKVHFCRKNESLVRTLTLSFLQYSSKRWNWMFIYLYVKSGAVPLSACILTRGVRENSKVNLGTDSDETRSLVLKQVSPLYVLLIRRIVDFVFMFDQRSEAVLFKARTFYSPQPDRVFEFPLGAWLSLFVFSCGLALSLIPILTELTWLKRHLLA